LCEDTEASQCTSYAVKTKQIITKYVVVKSSFVCDMLIYIVKIIVVKFEFLLEDCLFLVQNPTVTVQNGTTCREIMCYVVDMMLCLMSRYLKNLKLDCL